LAGAVGEQVEHRDTLGDARRMVLAGGGENGFRRGRVRIFIEEVVLDDPGMVVADLVGELHLRERILVEPELVAGHPGPRQLQLIEDAELHDDVSPSFLAGFLAGFPASFLPLIFMRGAALSTRSQFRRAGEPSLHQAEP
jgi:hypothetical protein